MRPQNAADFENRPRTTRPGAGLFQSPAEHRKANQRALGCRLPGSTNADGSFDLILAVQGTGLLAAPEARKVRSSPEGQGVPSSAEAGARLNRSTHVRSQRFPRDGRPPEATLDTRLTFRSGDERLIRPRLAAISCSLRRLRQPGALITRFAIFSSSTF